MTEFSHGYNPEYNPDQRSLVERLADIDPTDLAAIERELDAENWAYYVKYAGFDSLTPKQQATYVNLGIERLAKSLPEIPGEI